MAFTNKYASLYRPTRKRDVGPNDLATVMERMALAEGRRQMSSAKRYDNKYRREVECEEAKAERDRLREALEDIAKQNTFDEMDDAEIAYADFEDGYDEIIKRARAALQGAQDEQHH